MPQIDEMVRELNTGDEITLRMVRAGCDALTKFDLSFSADLRTCDVVRAVFSAMIVAQRQPPD